MAEKPTVVNPWYRLFKKGERGIVDCKTALVKRKESISDLKNYLFSGDTAMNHVIDAISNIEAQKAELAEGLNQLKFLLEEERKIWSYLGRGLLKHNHTIIFSSTQLEHAKALKLTENQVINLRGQRDGAIASIKQLYDDDSRIIKNILNAEMMFLPYENNNLLIKERLATYFMKVRNLKAKDALDRAIRAA